MVFSVPSLVARLSAVVTLLPGDVIFTGHQPEWGSK
jgi:2-keto-4-pentenoate hydratase/2-oxohepta-3-ene-1,7-dioic acid hydratase in catechol pathway